RPDGDCVPRRRPDPGDGGLGQDGEVVEAGTAAGRMTSYTGGPPVSSLEGSRLLCCCLEEAKPRAKTAISDAARRMARACHRLPDSDVGGGIMKLPRKHWLIVAGLIAFVALLNPSYSYVYVEGPNGPVKAEKWGFGPGKLFVYTRVAADENSVSV